MKKRLLALCALFMFTLAGCGQPTSNDTTDTNSSPSAGYEEDVITRVASLKGPTSMGLAELMTADHPNYTFSMHATADEIVPLIAKGEVDIALIPANLASTLYQKTEGAIEVININTLGVLEIVTPKDITMNDLSMLKDHTIYMTGKGTTPESALRYLVEKNDMQWDQLDIQFKTEATEVVSALQNDPDAFAVLPQPFATVATQQMKDRHIAYSLGQEWTRVSKQTSELVTGVTVVRKEFSQEHPNALLQFQKDAAASVEAVNRDPDAAASKIESLDIVKAAIAKQAIPRCNLVNLTGNEMKTALSGYLEALFSLNPNLVGGELPDDKFYAI